MVLVRGAVHEMLRRCRSRSPTGWRALVAPSGGDGRGIGPGAIAAGVVGLHRIVVSHVRLGDLVGLGDRVCCHVTGQGRPLAVIDAVSVLLVLPCHFWLVSVPPIPKISGVGLRHGRLSLPILALWRLGQEFRASTRRLPSALWPEMGNLKVPA